MSLIVCVYIPTGIVLAGDSRTTGTMQQQAPGQQVQVITNIVVSDHAYKVVLFSVRPVGVGSFGAATIQNQPIEHFILEFEASTAQPNDSVQEIANKLHQYFMGNYPQASLGFIVCGYDKQNNVDVPYVFTLATGNQPQQPQRVNLTQPHQVQYGILRGGDTSVVDRLLSQPQFVPAFQAMNLQDGINFAKHLIRTTIDQLQYEPRFSTIGGEIDILVLTPRGAQFISRKNLHP